MREPRRQCASDDSALRESVRDFEPSTYAAEFVVQPKAEARRDFSLESSKPQRAQGRRRWYDRGYRGGTAGAWPALYGRRLFGRADADCELEWPSRLRGRVRRGAG